MIIFLVAAAVIPSLLLMAWFHRRDLNPEPRRVLWRTAWLGVLSVIPVLIVVPIYGGIAERISSPLLQGTLVAFLNAAIPEEFFKLLVVVLYASRLRDFDEPMDGIVYGVAASLGFATIENILYVTHGGWPVAVSRALTSVPAHALFGAVMGLQVARAKFEPGRSRSHLKQALLWPVLLHGLYDAPLLSARAAAKAGTLESFPGWTLLLVPAVLILGYIWVRGNVARLHALQVAARDHS